MGASGSSAPAPAAARGGASPRGGSSPREISMQVPGTRGAFARRRSTDSVSDDEDEPEEEIGSQEHCCPCIGEICNVNKERRGVCYYCFLLVFAGFLVVFPLFLKWLIDSPMPDEYWHEAYPKFPALADKDFIKEEVGRDYSMSIITEIPQSPFGCNFSCIGSSVNHDSNEMSFPVTVKLNAPEFQHTAYPVLLASNDFSTWWVASDRRDARPKPFFPSHVNELSDAYRHVTPECSRPPDIGSAPFETIYGGETTQLAMEEEFSTQPIYVLVCVSWSSDSINFHSENPNMTAEQIGEHCQAVGGVCGWPCGSRPHSKDIPQCSNGIIDLSSDSIAGVQVSGANFSGSVSLRACTDGPGAQECTTSASPMSKWPCHKCAYNSYLHGLKVDSEDQFTGGRSQAYQLRYDSLPKMEVILKDVQVGFTDAVPRAYILTSTVDPALPGPAAMHGNGTWRKLYYEENNVLSDPERYPQPLPVKTWEHRLSEEETGHIPGLPQKWTQEEHYNGVMLLHTGESQMEFLDHSQVSMKSDTCFASKGALYLVACAVNESTYADFFDLDKGQGVAPPPFNDRCLAVSGKCARACTTDQSLALEYCMADGTISKAKLFEKWETPTNEAGVVAVFMTALLIGFAVKLMTYFPGVFSPEKHAQSFHSRQTDSLKYIAVCTPSGGESKACVARNLVGALSALPLGCHCPFHVVFADEGHRHPHKICFRALVQVFHCIPDGRMSSGRDPDAAAAKKAKTSWSHKEWNVKAFSRTWVELTRTLTLKECETGKVQEKIQSLTEENERLDERLKTLAEAPKDGEAPRTDAPPTRSASKQEAPPPRSGSKQSGTPPEAGAKDDETRRSSSKEEERAGSKERAEEKQKLTAAEDVVDKKTQERREMAALREQEKREAEIEKANQTKKRNTAEIKKLNSTIDKLCGLEALRRLQQRNAWPKAETSPEIQALESTIQKLRAELTAPEKGCANHASWDENRKAMHLDDCEAYYWQPKGSGDTPAVTPVTPDPGDRASSSTDKERAGRLYTLHYVARARPDEDERTLKVQHVARGTWYYRIPKDEKARSERTWLEWRESAKVYQDGEQNTSYFIVPLRTSRGKAGGLNFIENYLFEYTRVGEGVGAVKKHALFSIADARHQFQPDFFHETIPFFFRHGTHEVNFKVAFTQSPQYFPEMPDDTDYLDTNNANFFRLNCMLRNCAGGVSSCGTNGTWLIRDRRAGAKGTDSIWEEEEKPRMEFVEKLERRFFHESCKVEDTASSLDRVVKGKYSQYVNQRLSYGMAKDPTDYLAAVQRWAEGGVVLSLQTFLSCREGVHMIYMTLCLFVTFVLSLFWIIYGRGYTGLAEFVGKRAFGDEEMLVKPLTDLADQFTTWAIEINIAEEWTRDVWLQIFLQVELWLLVVLAFFLMLCGITMASYYIHNCGGRARRTRFPTTMAQWARLAISLDNLTYFIWFWTAFFWVGFNYYSIWARRWYHFEANGMVFFSWILQVLGWSLVITASARYSARNGKASNEVFFLSLTNVWRTTQLFYITAPLTLYSIMMGTSDFLRNRMLDVDISYWVGGDRGAVSKSIAQGWTLLLIVGALVSHGFFWFGGLPYGSVGGLLIVTFIALDVMHPCAFLWLGTKMERLPEPPSSELPTWQRVPLRAFQILISMAAYRNFIRGFVFHPRSTGIVKWIGPVQNVLFPLLTFYFPELGVNQALLLVVSFRT